MLDLLCCGYSQQKGDKKKNRKETTLSPSALSMMSAQPTSQTDAEEERECGVCVCVRERERERERERNTIYQINTDVQ